MGLQMIGELAQAEAACGARGHQRRIEFCFTDAGYRRDDGCPDRCHTVMSQLPAAGL
jgi:hypothetical protein